MTPPAMHLIIDLAEQTVETRIFGADQFMPNNELKHTLQRLHRELIDATDVDPELEALLATLDDDIHELLAEEAPEIEVPGVMVSAESLAARFAADHPRAEALVRELIAALGRMGV